MDCCGKPLTETRAAEGRSFTCEICRTVWKPQRPNPTAPPQDPWEAIRFLTVDQFITRVKLLGSNFQLNGYTAPEQYPFRLLLFIGKPGNEAAIELVKKFQDEITDRTRSMVAEANPTLPRPKP